MVREILKSFVMAYVVIPIIFYTVDMAAQSTFVDGGVLSFVILTVLLVGVGWMAFRVLLIQKLIKIFSPLSAALGAIVGLLHWVVPYMMIGSYWVWQTVPFSDFTPKEKKIILWGLINPFMNLYYFMCDGSLCAIVILAFLFVKMTFRKKDRST